MKFVKGQWYEALGEFWQYDGKAFRHAGEDIPVRNLSYADKLKSTTLTPDFTNATIWDECFSVHLGLCHITDINTKYDDFMILTVDGGNGCLDAELIENEGYKNNPTLFNSLAQFMAYWQEEALKLKGGE
jgi:hypothetical protein